MTALLEAPSVVRQDRFDELEDHPECEVYDGIEVEMPPMSAKSSAIAFKLGLKLAVFGEFRKIGTAYTEVKIALPTVLTNNRIPDVIFVPFSRWAANWAVPEGNAWAIVPDLCVEVISPSDLVRAYDRKIDEYFEAGVKQVWVINPDLAIVHIYESLDRMRTLRGKATISGIDFLPGFELPLADLFLEEAPVQTP